MRRTLGIILVTLGLAAWPVGARELPFSAWPPVSTATGGATAVVSADLDRDGDLDLVVAAHTADRIDWHANTGTGWSAPNTLASGIDGVRALAVADIDGDGDLDVVSASENDDTIAWYQNSGAATSPWTKIVIASTAVDASDIALADVDRDGDVDVIASSAGDDRIALYTNSVPTGSPWTATTISSVADGASGVVVADLDGDGDLDVASSSALDATIAWYENGGAPTWQRRVVSTGVAGASAIAAADHDRDGDVDLFSASGTGNTIRQHRSSGAAIPVFTSSTIATGVSGPRAIAVHDLDRDGGPDLLVASELDDTIAWLDHDRASGSWTRHVISSAADEAHGVHAADVDRDGDVDVLAASRGDGTVSRYENVGISRDARFEEAILLGLTGEFGQGLAVGDMDGDGDTDVVLNLMRDDFTSSDQSWLENPADGSTTGWTKRIVFTGQIGDGIGAGDVDADGDVDIMLPGGAADTTWLDNDGASPPGWTQRVVSSLGVGGGHLTAIDFDVDGDVDILNAQNQWFYENLGGSPPTFTGDFVDQAARDTAIGDVDRDGDPDTATVTQNGRVHWNEDFPGFFANRVVASGLPGLDSVELDDVDRDGDLDVIAGSQDGVLRWWQSDGNPTPAPSFTAQPIASLTGTYLVLEVADFDLDGANDLASVRFVLGEPFETLSWWRNEDSGSPIHTEHVIDDQRAYRIMTVADLDGDGDDDILFARRDVGLLDNCGGQYLLTTSAPSVGPVVSGSEVVVLEIELAHGGEAGDPALRWDRVRLRFTDDTGVALSGAQLDALVADAEIWLDTGSGDFDPAQDTLLWTGAGPGVSLAGGELTAAFAGLVSQRTLNVGQSKTLFVTVELEPDAAAQSPDALRVTHVSRDGDDAIDTVNGVPLAGGCVDVTSETIAPEPDSDGDGTADSADCAPSDPTTYPGAPEINDGLDNSCPGDPGFGLVDELAADGEWTGPFTFCWPAQSGATSYEVIRSSAPDFSINCTSTLETGTCHGAFGLPPFGGAFYYLVRAFAPNPGSWGPDSNGVERAPICP